MTRPGKYKRAAQRFLDPRVLEATARMTFEHLDRQGIKAAVGGGYAMQIYGSPRLTGDVDMVAAELPRKPAFLKGVKPLTFGGRRYTTADGIEVDLIVRADHLKGLYEDALEQAVSTDDGLPVLTPDYLAVIKFAAGRPKDEDDLVWLLQQKGLVDRNHALSIAARHLGGQFARDTLHSFMDEADWRSEREKRT